MKKRMALLLALTLVCSVLMGNGTTTDVIVHKVLMNETDFNAFDPDEHEHDPRDPITNLTGFFGGSATEIDGVVFEFYSTGTYTGLEPNDGATASYTYTTGQADPLKIPNGTYLMVEKFTDGYTGTGGELLTGMKAVPQEITFPIVGESGNLGTVHLYPKNTSDKPTMIKSFHRGIVSGNPNLGPKNFTMGEEIRYDVRTTVPKNAHYGTFKWTDTMSAGLTYNKDLSVKAENESHVPVALTKNTDYTITETDSGFTVLFTEAGLAKINDRADKLTIDFTYSVTLNENAAIDQAETNNIILEYGAKDHVGELLKIDPDAPEVFTGGEKFEKTDSVDTAKKLSGAQFIVQSFKGKFLTLKDTTGWDAYKTAEEDYQAVLDGGPGDEATLKAARDAAYEALNMEWTWGTDETQAFAFVSDKEGSFEVKGLEYGTYTLKEIKAPKGYALPSSAGNFTVSNGSYSDTNVVGLTNTKMTIPQTGGIGTAAFILGGAVLMGGALWGMKRKKTNEE